MTSSEPPEVNPSMEREMADAGSGAMGGAGSEPATDSDSELVDGPGGDPVVEDTGGTEGTGEAMAETRAARRAAHRGGDRRSRGGRGDRDSRGSGEDRKDRAGHAHEGSRRDRRTRTEGGTRGSRRAASRSAHPAASLVRRLGVPVATIVAAALLGLAGYAGDVATGTLNDQLLLAVAVAWAGLVIAWGWPTLFGSRSRIGAPMAIAVTALGAPAAVWRTSEEPSLTFVPVALAVGLVVMFLHQLLRRDGRGRLVQSIAATSAGISVAAIGACYIALARFDGGVQMLAVAAAAIAAGSLAELVTPVIVLRQWLLPVSMVLGGIGAAITSSAQGQPATARAVLVGFVVAAVSHSLRRVLSPLPAMATARAQVTSGVASVLVSGVVAYALAWVFLR